MCHCPCTCRLLEQLRQHPETQDFVYLRRVIRNSSLYNPYDLEVHLLPPLGTLLAACPGACGVVFCHPEHAHVALLPMARAAVSNHMYVISAIHPCR